MTIESCVCFPPIPDISGVMLSTHCCHQALTFASTCWDVMGTIML